MTDRDRAAALDAQDPLAPFRSRFAIADDGVVYLDGNSLGRLPAATPQRLDQVVREQWGERLIRSWSEGWMDLPLQVGDRLGTALLGARPGETVVCDTVTVNTYKALHAAMALRPERGTIVAHRGEFPTDRYVARAVANARGGRVWWIGEADEVDPAPASAQLVADGLDDDVAVVLLSVVDYRSAALADVEGITRVVHEAGAVVVWDCSHAVGSVRLRLHDLDADLAIGCTYKYVNGGPGAPAFVWAHERHHDDLVNPVPGWMGHADPFAMGPAYAPAAGVRRFMTGTPSAVALAAVDEGVALLAEAGMDAVRAKSLLLTAYAVELHDAWLAPLGVELASPHDPEQRGSHITLRHPDARALTDALVARGVVPDFRNPDGIRVGLAPLYTTFTEVHDGLAALRDLLVARGESGPAGA
ncbi:MAG: kynureninase [Candidatus Nanopelagicales bacterium]